MVNKILNEKELKKKLSKARAVAAVDAVLKPRAASTFYDKKYEKITINSTNRVTFSFPSALAQGLANASPEELTEVEIILSGEGLHWEKLDADLSIPSKHEQRAISQAWSLSHCLLMS